MQKKAGIFTKLKSYIVILLVIYYVIPLITFIPFGEDIKLIMVKALNLGVYPLFAILEGIAAAWKFKIYPLVPALIGGLYIPAALIYGFSGLFWNAAEYFILALLSNLATYAYSSTGKADSRDDDRFK